MILPLRCIGVVVPAHDEQDSIEACLASLAVAAGHPALRSVDVRVLTVLDSCTDDTSARVGEAISVDVHNVGASRRAGYEHLLDGSHDLDGLWLAATDADTVVPPHWLSEQARLRAAGADAVAGTVQVHDWREQPDLVRRAFHATYGRPPEGHQHVHGANLGVSAQAYLSVGGFPPVPLSEDQALVDALLSAGRRVVATGAIPVVTSGRRTGRARSGFADHLSGLAC